MEEETVNDRFYSASEIQELEESSLLSRDKDAAKCATSLARSISTDASKTSIPLYSLSSDKPCAKKDDDDDIHSHMSRFWTDALQEEEYKQALREGFYSERETPRHFLEQYDVLDHHRTDEFPHSRLMDIGRYKSHRHGDPHHHHHHHRKKHSKHRSEDRSRAQRANEELSHEIVTSAEVSPEMAHHVPAQTSLTSPVSARAPKHAYQTPSEDSLPVFSPDLDHKSCLRHGAEREETDKHRRSPRKIKFSDDTRNDSHKRHSSRSQENSDSVSNSSDQAGPVQRDDSTGAPFIDGLEALSDTLSEGSQSLYSLPDVQIMSPSPQQKKKEVDEEETQVSYIQLTDTASSPESSTDPDPSAPENVETISATPESPEPASPVTEKTEPVSSPIPSRGSGKHVGFFIGESPRRGSHKSDHTVHFQEPPRRRSSEENEVVLDVYSTSRASLPVLSEEGTPSLSQVSSHIHLNPRVTFSLGDSVASSVHALSKSETTPAEFQPGGVRKHQHEHIPTWRELEKRRARGSEVQLNVKGGQRPIFDSEPGMSEAAMDDLANHRTEDAHAMRMRKIENGQHNAGYKDDYEPAAKLERLPRSPDRGPHELFVEMDELVMSNEGLYEWKQKSRWIKYEEDVLEGAERWGKPHVASLSFHSMLELRKCLEKGAMILDLEEGDLQGIANCIVDELIAAEQLNPKHRADIVSSLLLKHTFMEDNKGFLRKNSHAYIGLVDLEEGKTPEAKSGVFGQKKYRFSEPYISLKDAKIQGKDKSADNIKVLHTNGVGVVEDWDSISLDGYNQKLFKRRRSKSKNMSKNSSRSSQNKALQIDDDLPHAGSLRKSQGLAGSTASIKVDMDLMKKIPKGAQTTSVLVGTLDYLEKPLMAFVRLSRGRYLGNFTQVPLPIRFIYVIMGPRNHDFEYKDVGRSISTLMSNKKFHNVAYNAHSRTDLLHGLNDFLEDSLVLPPGELDKKTLLPVLNMAKDRVRQRKQRRAEKDKAIEAAKSTEAGGGGDDDDDKEDDPLARTGKPFGGMIKDMRKRFPLYLSDIKDGLNLQCLSAFVFIYFAALSPAITFGGLLGDKTEGWMGVTEMLVGVSSMGLVFHLLAAQPLLICGFTGPLLVFEEGLFTLCGQLGLEYISFRVWVGFWVTAITVLVMAFEGSFLVRLISRFTEEIFAALISLIFIIEVFVKLASIYSRHPLQEHPDIVYLNTPLMPNTTMAPADMGTADSLMGTADPLMDDNMTSVTPLSTMMPTTEEPEKSDMPNTFLLSLILTFSTFLIAYFLRIFRNGKYLGRSARRALGDFGVPIAIAIMVAVDILIRDVYTEKLNVPDGLEPTDAEKRGWYINPAGMEESLPIWAYFAAAIPAFLVFILIFMETMITNIIVTKKLTPENKGAGYHWSMMLIGIFASFTGLLGLPFLTAATVRSVTHVNSLQVFGNTHAPGDKPVLEEVKEQRLTGILVHILIGVSVLMGPLLRQIPLAVLFGVFLYMGVASMSGVQLFDRVYLFFKPVKYHPDVGYVKNVRTWKMHVFTFIQIIALGVLWVVKSTQAALSFPFVLILLVPVRRFLLPKFFSDQELEELDKGDKKSPKEPIVYDSDEDDDFYTEAHMPI